MVLTHTKEVMHTPNKKSLKNELKAVCCKKIGNKALKWIGKFVRPYLPIDVKYNSPYSEQEYFYEFLHMGLTEGSAESSNEILNLRYKAPSPDSILRHLRFQLNKVEAVRDNVLHGIVSVAKKHGAFSHPVDIAIDPFDDPYYGDINDMHVVGTKRKAGTNYAHSFVCIDSIVKGERFCLGFLPRTMQTEDLQLVENLLKSAVECISIRIAMLDKEFYDVRIVTLLYRCGLEFIIPAPDTKEVKRLKKLHHHNLPCIIEHTITSGKGEQVRVKLALVKRGKEIHGFITNLDWEAEEVGEYYRNRWGIETNHRVRNKFIALTTSRNYELRFLYYLLAVVLHNIWVLINLIITKRVYGEPQNPVMTVRLMKEFIMCQLKSESKPALHEASSQSYLQCYKFSRKIVVYCSEVSIMKLIC